MVLCINYSSLKLSSFFLLSVWFQKFLSTVFLLRWNQLREYCFLLNLEIFYILEATVYFLLSFFFFHPKILWRVDSYNGTTMIVFYHFAVTSIPVKSEWNLFYFCILCEWFRPDWLVSACGPGYVLYIFSSVSSWPTYTLIQNNCFIIIYKHYY